MDRSLPTGRGSIRFGVGPFTLDCERGVLMRDGAVVPLRRKAWELLVYLAERPDQLLSGDAIFDAVWPDVAVTPKTLANVVAELRQALGDDPTSPRYIETVHRRGYRFIGIERVATDREPTASAPGLIGRDADLGRLRGEFERAVASGPRVAFVAGEPGIGKTSLVREFVRRLRTASDRESGSGAWVATGQCIERHGAHEAYMPILEAIANLATGERTAPVRDRLELFAPNWLQQIPWLLTAENRVPSAPVVPGFGIARMLREGTRFFHALSEWAPGVLVLEDVHWADPETVDFIAAIRRRPEPAPLLVVCTFRLAEARLHQHPIAKLADEARTTGAMYLTLENFTAAEVRAYLEQRFPGRAVAKGVSDVIEEHSGGNPLFVGATVDNLLERGDLVVADDACRLAESARRDAIELPGTVRGILDAQVQLLPARLQATLGVAAVAGASFAVAEVAAGLDASADDVELALAELSSASRFLARAPCTYGDADPAQPRFAFAHALYQRMLYERLPAPERRAIHQRVGEFLDRSGRASVNPAVVADHFDRSHDHARAAEYYEQCATSAARRLADRERLSYLEAALAHLRRLPDGRDRTAIELRIIMGIGESVAALHGPHHPRVAEIAGQSLLLCDKVDDPRSLFVALHGIWLYNILRGDLGSTRPQVEHVIRLAGQHPRPEIRLLAELQRGAAAVFGGDAVGGCAHLESAAALLGEIDEGSLPVTLPDVHVEIMGTLAWNLWLVGRADEALACAQIEYERTIERRDVISSVIASVFLCNVSVLRGEPQRTAEIALELQLMGEEFGIDLARATGMLLEASARVETLDLDAAFALLAAAGPSESDPGLHQIVRTYFITRLAWACGRTGAPHQGLLLLREADARIARSRSPISEPEVWRIRGELALQAGPEALLAIGVAPEQAKDPAEYAEACLRTALATARRHGTLSLELRAATSLTRLQRDRGRDRQPAAVLSEVYGRFDQGFETADLRAAAELLAERE